MHYHIGRILNVSRKLGRYWQSFKNELPRLNLKNQKQNSSFNKALPPDAYPSQVDKGKMFSPFKITKATQNSVKIGVSDRTCCTLFNIQLRMQSSELVSRLQLEWKTETYSLVHQEVDTGCRLLQRCTTAPYKLPKLTTFQDEVNFAAFHIIFLRNMLFGLKTPMAKFPAYSLLRYVNN